MSLDKWGYPTPQKDEDRKDAPPSDESADTQTKSAMPEKGSVGDWCLNVATALVFVVIIAVILLVLWFAGNFVWDCMVNIFGDDSGGSSRLAKYCAGKFARGSYLYRECIDDGWKPWYSTAQWLD